MALCLQSRQGALFRPSFHAVARLRGHTVRMAAGSELNEADVEGTSRVHDILGELEEIRNARCLSRASASAVRSGAVFRSATPAFARDADVNIVVQRLGVRDIIDLRSAEETDRDPADSGFESLVTRDIDYRRGPDGSMVATERPCKSPAGAAKGPGLTRHRVAIMDRHRFYMALLKRLVWEDPVTLACALAVRVWDGKRSQDMLLEKINQGGLEMLYEILLDTSGPELCKALQVLTEAAEEGRSAWFYCKAGKDRTGLVAMLTLSVMGASEEDIVEDYYASHVNRKVALGDIAKESELKKLDKEVFSGAPRESMQHTLRWIKQRHNSVEQYLDSIGFNEGWRQRMRTALEPAVSCTSAESELC